MLTKTRCRREVRITELITQTETYVYNTEALKPGSLIYARHKSWKAEEGIAGFVSGITKEEILVQYYPGIRYTANHFRIPAKEAAAGEWHIRWSENLTDIQEITMAGSDPGSL